MKVSSNDSINSSSEEVNSKDHLHDDDNDKDDDSDNWNDDDNLQLITCTVTWLLDLNVDLSYFLFLIFFSFSSGASSHWWIKIWVPTHPRQWAGKKWSQSCNKWFRIAFSMQWINEFKKLMQQWSLDHHHHHLGFIYIYIWSCKACGVHYIIGDIIRQLK